MFEMKLRTFATDDTINHIYYIPSDFCSKVHTVCVSFSGEVSVGADLYMLTSIKEGWASCCHLIAFSPPCRFAQHHIVLALQTFCQVNLV